MSQHVGRYNLPYLRNLKENIDVRLMPVFKLQSSISVYQETDQFIVRHVKASGFHVKPVNCCLCVSLAVNQHLTSLR